LLNAYLTSLTNECQQLRLQRLVAPAQTGSEEQAVPQLRLQAVYTELTTDKTISLGNERLTGEQLKRILDQYNPDVVAAEQSQYLTFASVSSLRPQVGGRKPFPADLPNDELFEVTRTRPELATEAIRTNSRLVLLGEPGAGKSMVLRYLALLLALRIQGHAVDLPPGWDAATPPVPIFCPLGTVAELLRTTHPDPDQVLWQAIGNVLDGKQGIRNGLRDHLKDAIRRGGVLLLFDGLDELPTSYDNPREQIARAIRRFAETVGSQITIVVTCRVLPYQTAGNWNLPADEGWVVRTLQPLAFGQVRQFVQQWYHELAGSFDEPAEERAERLITALHRTTNDRIQKLIESPLLLTMLAILHYNCNELPDERVEVYEQCVELLLDRWEPRRTPGVQREGLLAQVAIPDLKLEQLREELHKLALQAQEQPPAGDGRGMLDRYMLTGRLVDFFSRLRCPDPLAKVEVFVDGLVQEAGLLQAPADDRYAFPHLTFQEYLAACGLANRADMVNAAYGYWTGTDSNRWREVLLLFVGRLRQQGSLSVEQYAVPWLERLIAPKLGKQRKDPLQRARDAALAARSYQELGGQRALASTQIDVEAKVEAPLRTAIVDLLEMAHSGVALDDRVTAAQVLGDLGDDPRLLDPATGTSPDGRYWCPIDAGPFWYGDDRKEKLQQVSITYHFDIARYPLTNAEYACFVETGGYEQQEWWTEQGWQWIQQRQHTQPERFASEGYNNPSQPVVGVSWYEAAAFCHWLTAQGHNQGWLSNEEEIRLPTWLEWERAARHTDQRSYPWGEEEPTAEHANYTETGIERPSPVGCFPTGAAVCGAQDMAGNIQEWTSTSADNVINPVPPKDFTPDQGVIRTSSDFSEPAEKLVCGARHKNDPTARTSFRGFRLVWSLRSST
jgi:formylglycine-generating enzyme required for sulfatase activity